MNENCILSFSIIVDEQNGFRKDRSCLVYTIKQKRQPTFDIFMNLKKAFLTVLHFTFWNISFLVFVELLNFGRYPALQSFVDSCYITVSFPL